MRIKLRKQNKTDIQNNLQSVIELKQAIEFLHPELTSDEVKDKLLFLLGTIADPILLKHLWNTFNENANKKVDEVTDLYSTFFSDTDTPNNN